MLKKILLILFLSECLCSVQAIERISAPANTVLWDKPDLKAAPEIALTQALELQVEETRQVIVQNSVIYRNITFYRVRLDNRDYWMVPGRYADHGKIKEINSSYWLYLIVSGILAFLSILTAHCHFRKKQSNMRGAQSKVPWLILSLILFHYACFAYFRSVFPDTFQTPTDDNEYFRIANNLSQWDFSKPFTYTIGYPLLCIPFFWLGGSDNYFELSRIISYFSALIMMPISIILMYILLRKICSSATKAFIVILLFLAIPKLFLAVEYPLPGMLFSPFGIWHANYTYCAYMLCLTGFNSLSEWSSVNLLLLAVVAALCLRGSNTKYIMVGILFGLALLVRMNNVLWAPLIAYLFWINDREQLSDWRYLSKAVAFAAIPAFVIFSSQLVINHLQMGSIFKSPYDLHHEYNGGKIGLQYFANMSQYYFKIENLYFAVALSGLILTRNSKRRHILILWTIPTVLFFFCFNFFGYPYRFFLAVFPGLLAALICSDVWSAQTGIVKKWIFAGILLFLSIPILPFSFHFADFPQVIGGRWNDFVNFSYKLRLLLALPVFLTGIFYFRKDRKLCLFLLFFGIIIYERSSWIMVAIMIGLLFHTGYEWAKDLSAAMKTRITKKL